MMQQCLKYEGATLKLSGSQFQANTRTIQSVDVALLDGGAVAVIDEESPVVYGCDRVMSIADFDAVTTLSKDTVSLELQEGI